MGKYTKALLAFLTYGIMQLLFGLLIWLALYTTNGGERQSAQAAHPLMLALCLMASGALTALLVWRPMGMIRMPSAFGTTDLTAPAAVTGLLGGMFGIVALNLMSELTGLPDNAMETLLAMAMTPFGALTVGVVGPVCEELVFREGIQGHLMRHGTHPIVAIVFSSLLFGILHFNPLQTFFASLMGIVLGTLYCRTGSILLCALLHIANNSLAVLQMYVLGPEATDFSISAALGGRGNGVAVMSVCGVVCIALLYLFCRTTAATERGEAQQ